uniref:SSD domain-containing protein n=1 Tax=Parastrongyloides trichosuri TaxID=131310 RepID=A0A0N5A353_PARTI
MMENLPYLKSLSLTNEKEIQRDHISTTATMESQNSADSKSSSSDVTFDTSFEVSTNSSQPSLKDYNITSTCFNKFLNKTNYKIGLFVADYPKTVLATTLLITLICSIKIVFTPQKDDLRTGYTPFNSKSLEEMEKYTQFYDSTGEPLNLGIFLTAKDNGSMHRLPHLNESIELIDVIGNDFHIGKGNESKSFFEICSDFCLFNEPIRQFRNGLILKSLSTNSFETRINLTFPFITMMGASLDLSPNFFGTTLYEGDGSENGELTNIKKLDLIILQFRADQPSYLTREDIMEWERKVCNYINFEYNGTYLDAKSLSLTFVSDEVVRTGMTLFPYISVGFLIMSIFSIITVYMSSYYFDQWSKHKISMALMACVCPLFATSTALGLLFWFGFRFGSILCVTPFLVMAIGVDDAYLQIHSWQRICVERKHAKSKRSNECTEDYFSLRNRIAEVSVDVGPSILITSLTNILAFAIGAYTPTPEIQLFCIANVVAIFFDYFYQITMFLSIIVIAGDFELKKEEANKNDIKFNINTWLQKSLNNFMKSYCEWLSNPFTSFIIFLVMIFYLCWSFQSAMNIKVQLTPDKLFLKESIILDVNNLRDNIVIPNYLVMRVFVNNASGLDDLNKSNDVELMITEFETMEGCLGEKYSKYWKRSYVEYIGAMKEDVEEEFNFESNTTIVKKSIYSKDEIDKFLDWPEYSYWGGFLRFDNKTNMLDKFFVTIAFHGKEFSKWTYKLKVLREWRNIVEKYKDLDASVYFEDAPFLDQIDTIVPAMVSSSIFTLVCMAVICLIFMKNLYTMVVATTSIFSICIGVFGFLAIWDVDLDPISMATTIMSIGFSVDFPAHISYHYYRAGVESNFKSSVHHRILESLIAIGYPLLQCGISTILFVTCLLFIDTYMSQVFVKTMILVVSLGLLHGLIIVPSFLCMLSNLNNFLFSSNNSLQISNVQKKTSLYSSLKSLMSTNKIFQIKNDATFCDNNISNRKISIPSLELDGKIYDNNGKVSVIISNY